MMHHVDLRPGTSRWCRYREIVPTLTLSGPTSFAPAIHKALELVKETNEYHILIIIADGLSSIPQSTSTRNGQCTLSTEDDDDDEEEEGHPQGVIECAWLLLWRGVLLVACCAGNESHVLQLSPPKNLSCAGRVVVKESEMLRWVPTLCRSNQR